MTAKKLYVVKGSEDGVIGVYSNIKKAFESAVSYVSMDDNRPVFIRVPTNKKNELGCCNDKIVSATYSRFIKVNLWTTIENSIDDTTAQIELHYLNR